MRVARVRAAADARPAIREESRRGAEQPQRRPDLVEPPPLGAAAGRVAVLRDEGAVGVDAGLDDDELCLARRLAEQLAVRLHVPRLHAAGTLHWAVETP